MATTMVVGATGTVGSRLVRALQAKGVRPRAFVRDRSRARRLLGEELDLAVGDLADPSSVAAALDGADRVFLVCGNVPGQVGLECGLIDAAARTGVRHLVKMSALGASVDSPLLFPRWQGQIEAHLRQAEVSWTILRPAPFMTDLLRSADLVRATGTLMAPTAGAKVAMIDPTDIAQVAAVVLTTEGHEGRTYDLTGPSAVTWEEVAEALSVMADRTIPFVRVPDDAARQGMLAAGVPDFVADFLVALAAAMREGRFATTSDSVQAITGRAPRAVQVFLTDHASAFAT